MSRSASDSSSSSRTSDSRRGKRRRQCDRDRHRSRRETNGSTRRSPRGKTAKARQAHEASNPQAPLQSWLGAWSAWHFSGPASMHPGFVSSAWGGPLPPAYGIGGGTMANGYARDFADHRPDAYHAFVQTAIRSNGAGVYVGLPKRMCLDKHIPDFIACLSCWLRRNLGDPIQRPWRLQCLDLSHNSLCDESISQLMGSLRHNSIRLQRLLLSGNRTTAAAVGSITEYVWDNPEALCEIDLSGNEISVASESNGDDPVSALLRCFYNHSAYPRRSQRSEWVAGQREAFDLEPLILRIGGNFLKDPVQLLGKICEKAGRERVRLRPDGAVYRPLCDEFLSLYLPDFARQRKIGEAVWDSQASIDCTTQETSEELVAPDLDDLEEPLVQKALSQRLMEIRCDGSLVSNSADAVRWTIAGLALALLQTPKQTAGKMIIELESLVGNAHGRPLLEWLNAYLRELRC